MPINVRTDIYEPVCKDLLENTGVDTLDIMSEADFIRFTNEAISDFLDYSEYKHKVICLDALAFIGEYEQPDLLERTDNALYNGTACYQSYVDYVDNADPNNANNIGIPNTWYLDYGTAQNIRFTPTPMYNGDQVIISGAGAFYGMFSSCADANDFTVNCDPAISTGLFGTISRTDQGDRYVDVTQPMFGTVSKITSSNGFNGNFTLFGHVNKATPVQDLDEYIDMINPSFSIYLRFAVLARIFAGDSEYKDETREKYCIMRFLEGVNLCRAIMNQPALNVTK